MIFNREFWRKEALAVLGSTTATLYATILVCLYIAFSFTELVTFPKLQEYLENKGFFIYLYFVCDVYLIYLVYTATFTKPDKTDEERVVENNKVSV